MTKDTCYFKLQYIPKHGQAVSFFSAEPYSEPF